MTEFKKGDLIKDAASGFVFRIVGTASYVVQGHSQCTTVDWDDAVEPTKEEYAAFKEKERQKAVSLLAKAQREVQRLEVNLARVNSGQN